MRELGYSVECALQDLEKMNFDLITQQKQSLYNLGNGIYGINGTYTTYQLIHMVESLPEPQRSRKNKNKTKGKAQSSKFPIVDPGYDNGNWIRVYDPRLTRPMVLGDYLVKWSNMGITAMTD
ncbi:uncharacterized protein I206_107110 [Kwoniella pini CBS 10737]|uniref:Uncharacterized protein n=1 Tax=Kwoniella pini CBS 10737 TaxID=1296096 RepID=A0A1B9HZ46_9TREE|nr:uncharacterized protein I206_05346 [Kwoniella pini CBS 10737]OCF48567.1 hypothetical protein I206_05346 [Kwoniella pini CBS 10737]